MLEDKGLVTCVTLCVIIQTTSYQRRNNCTHHSLMGFFSPMSVYLYVLLKIGILGTGIITIVTLEWFLPCVYSLVHL